MLAPEQEAREQIDASLRQCGWIVPEYGTGVEPAGDGNRRGWSGYGPVEGARK